MQDIKKNTGFTLIELMVTLAVLAIIATMAAPSFSRILAKQRLTSNTQELIAIIYQARSQAVMLRKNTTVHLSSGSETPTDFYWQRNSNHTITSPTTITQIIFAKDGAISSGISADTDFVICNANINTTKSFALTKMGTVYSKADGVC